MNRLPCVVLTVGEDDINPATDLLSRFFSEEGLRETAATISDRLRQMVADPFHWIGMAWLNGVPVGVVTLTTMLYVEWGRLGEIGDLYVLPSARRSGIGAMLVNAATAKCRSLGCSAVSVTVTPEGEARHALSRYYARLGFSASGEIFYHALP